MWNWFTRKRRKPDAAIPPIAAIVIGERVIEETVAALRRSGTRQEAHEGVAYWAGMRFGEHIVVTTCIVPTAETTYGSFATSSKANARVVMYLAQTGLELLGQVHSHPGARVDHSDGDNERALMPYDGFLSLVVPHYARRGMPLAQCGVHVFERSVFRRLTNDEINSRFKLVPCVADLRD